MADCRKFLKKVVETMREECLADEGKEVEDSRKIWLMKKGVGRGEDRRKPC